MSHWLRKTALIYLNLSFVLVFLLLTAGVSRTNTKTGHSSSYLFSCCTFLSSLCEEWHSFEGGAHGWDRVTLLSNSEVFLASAPGAADIKSDCWGVPLYLGPAWPQIGSAILSFTARRPSMALPPGAHSSSSLQFTPSQSIGVWSSCRSYVAHCRRSLSWLRGP